MVKGQKMTFETKEYRNRQIEAVSGRMSEDAALVLEFIRRKTGKDNCSYSGDELPATTMEKIVENTLLNETRIRWELHSLVITGFVIKNSTGRFNRYSISDDGSDAAEFLMDEQRYPGRKMKFRAILDAKKEGR